MVGISGGGGGGGGYNYVQDAQPSGAVEGEEWYDTGANAAYVYDGASWIEQTVTDHGNLSGITASDHHVKPTPGVTTDGTAGMDNDTSTSTSMSISSSGETVTKTISTRPVSGARTYITSSDGSALKLDWLQVKFADGTTYRESISTRGTYEILSCPVMDATAVEIHAHAGGVWSPSTINLTLHELHAVTLD